jgi:uncharacterized protein (TIGR02118 family)
MARMVAIYKTPKDPSAFDEHYFSVHIPLAKKLPGLRGYDVSRGTVVTPTGGPEPYLVATLHFDDRAAILAAFATPEGKACAADRRVLVPNDSDVQIHLFDTAEV